MSEFQYYEFRTVDRPLSAEDREALRAISTRAEITATSFTNSYSWGDLKGAPVDFMVQWFDLHVYVTNWSTRRFMLRLPKRLVDVADLQTRLARFDDLVKIRLTDEHLILDINWTDEEPDDEWVEEESWLPALAPLRTDILEGDLRFIHLLWLKALQLDVVEDSLDIDDNGEGPVFMEPDDPEPMAGIGPLTEQLRTFAEFFRIDPDLIAAAAERSPDRRSVSAETIRMEIATVPEDIRTDILTRLYAGDPIVMTEWRVAVRAALPSEAETAPSTVKPRTAAEVLARSIEIRTVREKAEADRKLAEQRRLAREAEAARRAHLDMLATRGERVWDEIEREIERRNGPGYDAAAGLILDMQTLALKQGTDDEFVYRLEVIRERHARKPRFIDRLADF